VHHTAHQRARATRLWQGLTYLSTAGLGLVLYRLAHLPLVVAILAGFVATIALATIGYLIWLRDHNHHSKQ
jgi:hypothetical protein